MEEEKRGRKEKREGERTADNRRKEKRRQEQRVINERKETKNEDMESERRNSEAEV